MVKNRSKIGISWSTFKKLIRDYLSYYILVRKAYIVYLCHFNTAQFVQKFGQIQSNPGSLLLEVATLQTAQSQHLYDLNLCALVWIALGLAIKSNFRLKLHNLKCNVWSSEISFKFNVNVVRRKFQNDKTQKNFLIKIRILAKLLKLNNSILVCSISQRRLNMIEWVDIT